MHGWVTSGLTRTHCPPLPNTPGLRRELLPRTEVPVCPAWGQCGHRLSGEWVVGGAAPFPELVATSLPKPHEEAQARPPLCCLGGEASSESGPDKQLGQRRPARLTRPLALQAASFYVLGGRVWSNVTQDCLSCGRTHVFTGEVSFQTLAVRSRKVPERPGSAQGRWDTRTSLCSRRRHRLIASLST